jgi:hypothetical protein
VKSNIKDDPVFYNVSSGWLNIESRLHFQYQSFL